MMNKNENTTEATRGSSLRVRVEARKQELEQALAKLGPDDRARVDIEQALNEITGLLTGDLDQIPRVVAPAGTGRYARPFVGRGLPLSGVCNSTASSARSFSDATNSRSSRSARTACSASDSPA